MRATEVSNAQYIFTLVHGTWATNAAWTQDSSVLCTQIRNTFGQAVYFDRFPWKGRNSVFSREDAARRLSTHIEKLRILNQFAKHFIVAHSHGGNVALYALRELNSPETITALVCLSTPFLYPRNRELMEFGKVSLFITYVAWQFLMIVLWGPAGILVGPITLVAFEKFKKSLRQFAQRLEQQMTLPVVKQPLLVVRSKWDEALAMLVGARLLTEISSKLWSFAVLPFTWASRLNDHLWVRKWTVRGVFLTLLGLYLLQPITIFCDGGVSAFLHTSPPVVIRSQTGDPVASVEPKGPTFIACDYDHDPPRIHDYGLLGAILGIPYTMFVLSPWFLISYMLVLAVIMIVGISLIGFKAAISHVFLDFSVKDAPRGHFDEFICSSPTFPTFTSLRHSLSYQDPVCIGRICDWLREQGKFELDQKRD